MRHQLTTRLVVGIGAALTAAAIVFAVVRT
jgi:hypothetical protein